MTQNLTRFEVITHTPWELAKFLNDFEIQIMEQQIHELPYCKTGENCCKCRSGEDDSGCTLRIYESRLLVLGVASRIPIEILYGITKVN